MTAFTRFVRNVHEETFSKDILRSFGSVTIADGRGGTFETNVSLLAALSPGLRPILSEVLQTSNDGMLLIVPESSEDTLNHLDNIFHCGETKVSCTDVQQFAQEMMDLKEDLRCLGLNVPENFWTLQTIERPRFPKDEMSELPKNEIPELPTSEMEHIADLPVENSVNDEQEDNDVEREEKDEEMRKKLGTIEKSRFPKDEMSELPKNEIPELPISEIKHIADLPVENSVNDEQEDNDVKREEKDEEMRKKLQTFEKSRFPNDETSELPKIKMPELSTSEMEHIADLPVENSVNDRKDDHDVEIEKKDEEMQKKSLEDSIWVKYSEEIEKPAYYCLICKIFYLNTKFLRKHLELRHPDLKVNFRGLYDCQDCSKSLRGQMMFFRHITEEICKVDNVVCDICGVSFPKYCLASHKQRKHEFDEKECKDCGKLFQNQACLKKHMQNQHGDPIPCQFCGKQFKTTIELKKHIANKHTADEDKPFMCELCGKRYGVKKSVKLHHLAAHNGGRKDFHCNFCEYKTWSKPNRDKHEKTVHKGM